MELALAGEARASALARVAGPLRDSFTPPELRAELDAERAFLSLAAGELGPAEVVATKATYAAPDLGRAWLALGLVHDAARRVGELLGRLALSQQQSTSYELHAASCELRAASREPRAARRELHVARLTRHSWLPRRELTRCEPTRCELRATRHKSREARRTWHGDGGRTCCAA